MRRAFRFIGYTLVIILGISMIFPFLWMLCTSLMNELEVYHFPPKLLPTSFRWLNYGEAMTLQPFPRYFFNTMVVASVSIVGQLLFCSMAAYAFARIPFRGREKLFAVYLGTMMIPAIVTIIPAFLIITTFGWMNTYWALFTPSVSSVWGIFLLRQFFKTIPKDLEDAARIDGASDWTIYWRIILPLSKPALATLALFAFIGSWKDFLWPLIVTNHSDMRTVEVGIAAFSGLYQTDWPHQMAAAVLVMLPVVIVFFLAQRYFIRGITFSGLKG